MIETDIDSPAKSVNARARRKRQIKLKGFFDGLYSLLIKRIYRDRAAALATQSRSGKLLASRGNFPLKDRRK